MSIYAWCMECPNMWPVNGQALYTRCEGQTAYGVAITRIIAAEFQKRG